MPEKNILELIPQRPPMVLIDALIFADTVKSISNYHIKKDSILVEDGHFSEPGMIENIAQTAAAGVGYNYKLVGKKPPIGFIASIKDLKVLGLAPEGALLTTEVTIENQVMEFSIIKGKVFQDHRLLLECEMRIFIQQEEK